jgi:hypothetical protein
MRKLLTSLYCAAAGLLCPVQPALAGENAPASVAPRPTTPAQALGSPDAATGGMMIHIDPRTGAILSEPAPGTVPLQLSPQLRNSISTSHQGLVEVPGTGPGGGVKVDLQGRFQSPLAVTVDPSGTVKTHHIAEPPASGGKK